MAGSRASSPHWEISCLRPWIWLRIWEMKDVGRSFKYGIPNGVMNWSLTITAYFSFAAWLNQCGLRFFYLQAGFMVSFLWTVLSPRPLATSSILVVMEARCGKLYQNSVSCCAVQWNITIVWNKNSWHYARNFVSLQQLLSAHFACSICILSLFQYKHRQATN